MQKNILKYVSFKLAAFQRMTHIWQLHNILFILNVNLDVILVCIGLLV